MITVEEFIERARSWLGVPFHHQGRSRFGVDCIGLPEAILREAGVLPAGFKVRMDYGRFPTKELHEGLCRWCEPSEMVRGALLTIRWPKQDAPSHTAIYTGPTMIHAYRKATGVTEHPYRSPWPERTAGFWKLPGVRYE